MTTDPHRDLFNAVVPAPFGALGIRIDADQVREFVYLPPSFAAKAPDSALAAAAAGQVERYFADPDAPFDLPLYPAGTAFQRTIWEQVQMIPRGKVVTYGHLARLAATAARAVGQACGANPFPLIIPCHRVTAASGLGGFAQQDDEHGFHLSVKRWLLRHEGAHMAPWQQQAIWP